ncbi:hypothetical protein [uncultured Bradyrhizobium sp.]|jgi:hypothetical protein|uniref:hypothetical protein n=1 Tax=uncultured Bradyrhizobium sp. TaxID=199684 RepID=UPI00261B573D|nr:hypothetical protein [uncultured Bradyrhizobium sp.]
MKAILIVAFVGLFSPANAETNTPPKDDPSIRDQIMAERAKYKQDLENSTTKRPWDRDANGERPFDRKFDPMPRDQGDQNSKAQP